MGSGSGSIDVTPTSTTAYTLSLSGPGGSVNYNATVNVSAAPVISSFTATPSSINPGDAVTFAATFSGGTGVITPGGYSITSGGTYVLSPGPSTATTYTLTVTAPCGSDSETTADVTVTMAGAPTGSLSSSGDISIGCSAVLNWTASGATTGVLNPGSISVPVGDGSGSITVTPVTTTTYTLSLTGPGGSTDYNATVNVSAAPAITAFSASPAAINAGETVTFSATFSGGTGVITPGNYPITSGGTYNLATGPATSTTYTLTVTAPCGSASQATADTTVAVGNAPSGSLTSSGDISAGCTATLNWTANNATSGTLTPGDIAVNVSDGSGAISVAPTVTNTYTLTLTGAGGSAVYTATVTVSDAPAITAFSASPDTISPGDPVTFSATFTGGSGVITPGNFAITSGGTYTLTNGPSTSTDYTLTVTAPCGSDSQATQTLTVSIDTPPSGSLTSGGAIAKGCTGTLLWSAENAVSGTLEPGGISVPVEEGSGTITVKPNATTTYTLTLTGPGGTTEYSAEILVSAAPQITFFNASPAHITSGDPVTFAAEFSGGTGLITPGNFPISSGGTYLLETGPSATTVYTLTVSADCGSASSATAQTTVKIVNNRLTAYKSVTDVNGGNLRPGEELLYTITIVSLNDEDLSTVVFNDTIPANTSFVEGSVSAPNGSMVYTSATAIQVTEITVPAWGQVSISFKVTVDNPLAQGVTEISNQGIVQYDKNGDGINDTNVPTDGNTVVPGEQPTVISPAVGPNFSDSYKSYDIKTDADGNGLPSPGDTIRYTMVIINSGDSDSEGVLFSDSVPQYTTYAGTGLAASSGSVSYDAAADQILWTGSVAAGGAVTITFDVVIDLGIPLGTLITNQGLIQYDSDGNGSIDSQELTDGNTALPGEQPTEFLAGYIDYIPATKTATPINSSFPTPGDLLRYDIEIENPSAYTLTGIEFVDTIPANTTLVEGTISVPPGAAIISQAPTIRVNQIFIPPFSSVKLSFVVEINPDLPPSVDRISNQGVINFDSNGNGVNDSSSLTDWNPLEPGSQPTITIITCPTLEITDTPIPETVECDEAFEYLVKYTNTSGAPAKNVILRSIYDSRTQFVSASRAPDQGTDDVWTIGTLAAGETGFIRIKVKMKLRLPFLYVPRHQVVITTHCDTRQAGARTNVLGCGPR